MTERPRRRTLVFGRTVDFQSRNTHISTVRWRSRFKEEYATDYDVRIAVHAWMVHGKTFFASEISRGDADDFYDAPLLRQAEVRV